MVWLVHTAWTGFDADRRARLLEACAALADDDDDDDDNAADRPLDLALAPVVFETCAEPVPPGYSTLDAVKRRLEALSDTVRPTFSGRALVQLISDAEEAAALAAAQAETARKNAALAARERALRGSIEEKRRAAQKDADERQWWRDALKRRTALRHAPTNQDVARAAAADDPETIAAAAATVDVRLPNFGNQTPLQIARRPPPTEGAHAVPAAAYDGSRGVTTAAYRALEAAETGASFSASRADRQHGAPREEPAAEPQTRMVRRHPDLLIRNPVPVRSLARLDDRYVLVGGDDEQLSVLDVRCGRRMRTWRQHMGPTVGKVHSAATSGRTAVTGADDGRLRWWAFDSDRVALDYAGITTAHCDPKWGGIYGPVRALAALVPGASLLFASGGEDGLIKLWAPPPTVANEDAEPRAVYTAPTRRVGRKGRVGGGPVNALVPVARSHLACGARDGYLRVWDVSAGKLVSEDGQRHGGTSVASLAAHGTLLATGGGDATTVVTDARAPPGAPVAVLPAAGSGRARGTAILKPTFAPLPFDTRYCGGAHGPAGNGETVLVVHWSPHDGEALLTAGFDPIVGGEKHATGWRRSAQVWDVRTWRCRQHLDLGSGCASAAVSTGGITAVGNVGGDVTVWDWAAVASEAVRPDDATSMWGGGAIHPNETTSGYEKLTYGGAMLVRADVDNVETAARLRRDNRRTGAQMLEAVDDARARERDRMAVRRGRGGI